MFTVDQGPAWVVAGVAVVNAYLTWRNGRKSAERAKETVQRDIKVDEKLDALHKSTNGLSERNEAIALKLGIAEGTATGLEQGRQEER